MITPFPTEQNMKRRHVIAPFTKYYRTQGADTPTVEVTPKLTG